MDNIQSNLCTLQMISQSQLHYTDAATNLIKKDPISTSQSVRKKEEALIGVHSSLAPIMVTTQCDEQLG